MAEDLRNGNDIDSGFNHHARHVVAEIMEADALDPVVFFIVRVFLRTSARLLLGRGKDGGRWGIRTPDLSVANAAFSQLN